MLKMRVLLIARKDLYTNSGGDTNQVEKLRHYLISENITVGVKTNNPIYYNFFDIFHIFNITRVHDSYWEFLKLKKYNKPIIVTPNFHNLFEFNRKGRIGFDSIVFKILKKDDTFEKLRGLYRIFQNPSDLFAVLKMWQIGYMNEQRELVKNCDMLVPSTDKELIALLNYLNIDKKNVNFTIIPIGVENPPNNVGYELFYKKYKLKDFVLCVGRFEPLKNQLNLIKALIHTDLKLVLIGYPKFNHIDYYYKLIKLSKGAKNIYIIEKVNRDMIWSAYKCAKVHIQPSWIESSGLTTLEASLCGCSIVLSSRSYLADTLKPYIFLCEPEDIEDIKNAVLKAFNSKPNPELRRFIIREFSYKSVVKKWIELYKKLIEKRDKEKK